LESDKRGTQKRKYVNDQFDEVAKFMSGIERKFEGSGLKAEWTSLRNSFNRYKREAKPKSGDEGGTGYDDIVWKFWKPMAKFLLSVNKFNGADDRLSNVSEPQVLASIDQQIDVENSQDRTEVTQPVNMSSSTEATEMRDQSKERRPSSNRKRKKKGEVDEMDRAIFDKLMNSKKVSPLTQMGDEMIGKPTKPALRKNLSNFDVLSIL